MRHSNPFKLLMLLLVFLPIHCVQAQFSVDLEPSSPSLVMTLASLKAQLWSAHVHSSVWQQRQELTQAQLQQATTFYNPSIDVSAIGWRSGQREQTLVLSQPLDIRGQRQAQRAVLSQQVGAEQLRQSRYQAEFELLFHAHTALLLNANRNVKLIQQQLQLQQDALTAAQQQFTAGAIAQVEVQRIALQVSRLQSQSQQASWQQQQAIQQFIALGAESYSAMPTLPQLMQWDLSLPAPKINQTLPTDDLVLAEASQRLETIQAQQRQLETQARSNPTLSIGVQRDESGDAISSNTRLILGVSMPIQLFRNNLHQQAAMQAQLQWQASATQALSIQRQRQIAALQARSQQQRQQLRQLHEQILPSTEQLRQKTWLGFKAGKFSLLDAQQAQRDVLDAMQVAAELENSIWQTELDLQGLAIGWESERLDLNNPTLLQRQWHQWQQSLWSNGSGLVTSLSETNDTPSGENP